MKTPFLTPFFSVFAENSFMWMDLHNDGFRRPDFAARAAIRRASPANPNPETFFYHSDHLGNTSFVTDRSGALTQHVEYLPFGEPLLEQRGSAGNWQTDRLFNSKEYDAETGLYYYGARYYDPRLAIWLSPDPLQEKYPNISTYCYAFNSPVAFFDLYGKENLIVVGSQYNNNSGSKLMFVNQGIRAMQELDERGSTETRTMLLFEAGYTENQLKAIQQSVTNYGGQLIMVASSTELVNYINTKTINGNGNGRSLDKISKMEIYSHGLFGSIEFGYKMDEAEIYKLDSSNVSKLSKDAFNGTDSQIYSYACRTGLGRNFNKVGYYEYPNSSLAQTISNATNATVFAFAVRTDYTSTLGTRTERNFGFPNPAPETKLIDGAIFTPQGAAHPVRGASTPLFLPHKKLIFTPK